MAEGRKEGGELSNDTINGSVCSNASDLVFFFLDAWLEQRGAGSRTHTTQQPPEDEKMTMNFHSLKP